jgi:hypothetical protein
LGGLGGGEGGGGGGDDGGGDETPSLSMFTTWSTKVVSWERRVGSRPSSTARKIPTMSRIFSLLETKWMNLERFVEGR